MPAISDDIYLPLLRYFLLDLSGYLYRVIIIAASVLHFSLFLYIWLCIIYIMLFCHNVKAESPIITTPPILMYYGPTDLRMGMSIDFILYCPITELY